MWPPSSDAQAQHISRTSHQKQEHVMTIIAAAIAAELSYRQTTVREGIAAQRRGRRVRQTRREHAAERSRRAAALSNQVASKQTLSTKDAPTQDLPTQATAVPSPRAPLSPVKPEGVVGARHDDGPRANRLREPAGRA